MKEYSLDINWGLRKDLVLKIKNVLESYSDILSTAILFGSTARGSFTDNSDIDLFLTCDFLTSTNFVRHKRCFELVDSLYALVSGLRIDYDLLFYGKNELKNVKNSSLYKQIEEDGVVLYADKGTETV